MKINNIGNKFKTRTRSSMPTGKRKTFLDNYIKEG